MDLAIDVGSATDVGLRYPANFDVLHTEVLPAASGQGLLVVVADGMGAGEGSAAAGRIAVKVFVTGVHAMGRPIGPEELRVPVDVAHRQVIAEGLRLNELAGCTLTALVTDGTAGWIVQIGDSRAYRLRDGLLEQLTVDHNMAWMGAVYGWFAPESPEARRARYQMTRFVGHPAMPEPDVLHLQLRPGDVYCLCTDGIADQVPYARLQEALESGRPPREIAAGLAADAQAAGGDDNSTVAVVSVAATG